MHSSDELYGADRILLDLLGMLPEGVQAEVWLPTDVEHPAHPLCVELERRGVSWRHVDLPVLRRAYRTPRDLLRLARRFGGLVRRLRRLRRVRRLRHNRPDAVYSTTSAVLPAVTAARLAGIRRTAVHVQEIWSPADRRLLAPFARGADRVLAISPAVADALPPALRRRTTVVRNATRDPGPPSALPGRTGRLRLLVASRWNGWKGHRTLLAAWAAAGCPGELTVLGAMPASGDAVDVRALVAALPDPSSVVVVGEVDEIAPYIAAADVVVVPSDRPEPFGLVAVEAFAAGRPVIASDAGGLAEIVTHGHDGWLFPPTDVTALTALLVGLDRDEVARAGNAARRSYEERFTLDRYSSQWRAELAELLS